MGLHNTIVRDHVSGLFIKMADESLLKYWPEHKELSIMKQRMFRDYLFGGALFCYDHNKDKMIKMPDVMDIPLRDSIAVLSDMFKVIQWDTYILLEPRSVSRFDSYPDCNIAATILWSDSEELLINLLETEEIKKAHIKHVESKIKELCTFNKNQKIYVFYTLNGLFQDYII